MKRTTPKMVAMVVRLFEATIEGSIVNDSPI